MTASQLPVSFFIQMFVILLACRGVGWVARRFFGQPQVVGEMIAGVLLGPTFLGLLFPEWHHYLFSKDSLKMLYVGAQLGVGMYMFLVGLDFRIDLFRSKARSAVLVSSAGILVPFSLALILAPWLLKVTGLFSRDATLFEAMFFLGAAISITAFPMLARTIYERKLSGTALGTLALSAGAIDDMAAWCILAIVLASFGEGPTTAFKALAGGVAYGAVVLTLGRWLLTMLGRIVERQGSLSNAMLAVLLGLLMLAAWVTETIGIHAVFGGFLLGIVVPRGVLTGELQQKLEPFAVVFLVPMFFTFSGLNTQLNVMVGDSSLLLIALVVFLASVLGKGIVCWAVTRMIGEKKHTAIALGALMNARGLMELIIVNIGLQMGIIEPTLFSILVSMAILTTLMASPIVEIVLKRLAAKSVEFPDASVHP